jgi:hypothetical protein
MPGSPSTSSSASGRNSPTSFRFRPRYRLFAYGTAALGAAFTAAPLIGGFGGGARTVALIIGIGGLALALLYLVSPAWRIVVVVDDGGLEVLSSGDRRFYLAWTEIERVVASPSTRTCFVDGGSPDRSLKVPGKGAPAPYAIEDRDALYRAIMARVPAEVVEEVPYLEVEVAE